MEGKKPPVLQAEAHLPQQSAWHSSYQLSAQTFMWDDKVTKNEQTVDSFLILQLDYSKTLSSSLLYEMPRSTSCEVFHTYVHATVATRNLCPAVCHPCISYSYNRLDLYWFILFYSRPCITKTQSTAYFSLKFRTKLSPGCRSNQEIPYSVAWDIILYET